MHNIYEFDPNEDPRTVDKLFTLENGKAVCALPIRFNMLKPTDENGQQRDQTGDAARNMRYAASLGLPEVKTTPRPRMGKALIVGGAPSIKGQLENIRKFAADPENWVFAINWSHTWLIQNGIVPKACLLFEIDAEPETMLKGAHPDVTYYICSHCDRKTFDGLANCKRILWHSVPNSDGEKVVAEELFKDSAQLGGGVGTFTRTMTLALFLGFRSMELFGIDSSFPADSTSTHVEGYETANNVETDALWVHARNGLTGEVRSFRTVGYLALQVEEFKLYCEVNHHIFSLRVHGDSLLRFAHEQTYPDQYA